MRQPEYYIVPSREPVRNEDYDLVKAINPHQKSLQWPIPNWPQWAHEDAQKIAQYRRASFDEGVKHANAHPFYCVLDVIGGKSTLRGVFLGEVMTMEQAIAKADALGLKYTLPPEYQTTPATT